MVALLDGGADVNDVSTTDKTTPLLLAAINGQFDIAMTLIQRGANPNLASTAGATPLYAVINTQWRPRSRFPQPHAVEFQQATHLEVMEALLKAGAQPNVRIKTHLWYFAYNNCGSGNCGLENLEGTTPFWRAAYAVDVDAMKLLDEVRRRPDHSVAAHTAAAGAAGGAGGGGAGGGGGGGGGRQQAPAVTRSRDRLGRARRCRRASACIRCTPRLAWAMATASPATHIAMRPTAGCRR